MYIYKKKISKSEFCAVFLFFHKKKLIVTFYKNKSHFCTETLIFQYIYTYTYIYKTKECLVSDKKYDSFQLSTNILPCTLHAANNVT